jgi:hypothetical protein
MLRCGVIRQQMQRRGRPSKIGRERIRDVEVDLMDETVEITLRISSETAHLLASHAKRDGVTSAVVAQRWLADRRLQERYNKRRFKEVGNESVSYGLGGYLITNKDEE